MKESMPADMSCHYACISCQRNGYCSRGRLLFTEWGICAYQVLLRRSQEKIRFQDRVVKVDISDRNGDTVVTFTFLEDGNSASEKMIRLLDGRASGFHRQTQLDEDARGRRHLLH